MNLPNSFTRGPEFSTNNIYRADGVKLHKRNVEMTNGINGTITSTTDINYLDGFQYSHTYIQGGGTPGGGGEIIDFSICFSLADSSCPIIKQRPLYLYYNYLNLPNSFTRGPEFSTNNIYRADGVKLHKRNVEMADGINGMATSTTDINYLDGFQYSYREGGGICLTCRT